MEVWGGIGRSDNGVSMPGLDVWVLAQPHGTHAHHAQSVGAGAFLEGGDVHYVSSCGTGRITRLLVADVAGHGPKVAALATALRDLMRRHINTIQQSAFVQRMNAEFAEASRDSGGRFATAFVATYFAPSSCLVACNAGHPRPLAFSSRTGTWKVVTGKDGSTGSEASGAAGLLGEQSPTDLPLGIMDDTRYNQFALKLREGDLVLLYTDALTEARRADGTMLGEDGLLTILSKLNVKDPARLAPELLAAVTAAGMTPPDDDVTIMLVRPRGGVEQAPFLQRLASSLRFIKIGLGRLAGRKDPIPWPELSVENILGGVIPSFGRRAARGVPEL